MFLIESFVVFFLGVFLRFCLRVLREVFQVLVSVWGVDVLEFLLVLPVLRLVLLGFLLSFFAVLLFQAASWVFFLFRVKIPF